MEIILSWFRGLNVNGAQRGRLHESGSDIVPDPTKKVSTQFPLGFHLFPLPLACVVERYDDLLLLDNRWSAQLQGIASGEPPHHRVLGVLS